MMDFMNELVFEVSQQSDGGFCAECLTEGIFTQADSWEQLRTSVVDAVNDFISTELLQTKLGSI